jgi:hypothetical protein
MPWRATIAMDEHCRCILDAKEDLGHFTELCTRYGVSTKMGYKWLRRDKEGGMANLQPISSIRALLKNRFSPHGFRSC